MDVRAHTKFWGFDVNARENLCCGCDYRVDGLLGYRHLKLEDDLTMLMIRRSAPGPLVADADA